LSLSPLSSPVVLDADLSDEKVAELLGHQAEYPELDFKKYRDPSTRDGIVELALDVGAMQMRGGYIVVGADDNGNGTGDLDDVDPGVFDEATLTPRLLKYLPEPLDIRTRTLERDGHKIAVIYVGRNPAGCAFFKADGQYEKQGNTVVRFRAGDVYWRDGTRSVPLSQQGFEEIIERRIADAKRAWLDEQQEIRRRERAEAEAAVETRQVSRSTLGAVNFDLETPTLTSAALELVRDRDEIALRHLLNDGTSRARDAIARGEIETELTDVLDKLACLAATFLMYQQEKWFDGTVASLVQIYSDAASAEDLDRFDRMSRISPTETGPHVWLLVIERVYGLGALAVRLRRWEAVKTLALQLPEKVKDYYGTWLRHALAMASAAQHLNEQRGEQTVELNLLSRARTVVEQLDCLRADGIAADAEAVVTSLAQFDFLSAVAAIGASGDTSDNVFWPNFAQFRQERIQPVADQLVDDDSDVRQALFPTSDAELAEALKSIERFAHRVGIRFNGFVGWERTPVAEFIEQHRPAHF
jgi:hypothetical protein